MKPLENIYPDVEVVLINLADYVVQFSDGRSYLEYEGDTGFVKHSVTVIFHEI